MAGPHVCPRCSNTPLVPDPFGSNMLVCPLCQHAQAATLTPDHPPAPNLWWASAPPDQAAQETPQPEACDDAPIAPGRTGRFSGSVLLGLAGLGLVCFAIPLLVVALSSPATPPENPPPVVAVVTPKEEPSTPTPPAPPVNPLPMEPVERPQPFVERPIPAQPVEEEKPTPLTLPELPPVPEKPPVVEEPTPVVQPVPEPQTPKLRKAVGSLQRFAEADLRRMLDDTPETGLERVPGSTKFIVERARILNQNNRPFLGPLANLPPNRTDLVGLPMRMGKDCHLGKEEADNLHALSRKLRTAYEQAMMANTAGTLGFARGGVPADPRIDAERLDSILGSAKDWESAEAVPTMLQMMQAENKPVRKVLIDRLAAIPDRRATTALAMRAVTELSPELREAALLALKSRPAEDYRPIFLAGLRYPFAPMSEHAAEGLVALEDTASIPMLVKMLDLPPVSQPIQVGTSNQFVVRELVRVNHLGNCALCHQPSFDTNDMVRGAIPTPGTPIPGPATTPAYYDSNRGDFVRADITYLRQDFSLMQPVQQPNNWPNFQRYDYLVRLRKPNKNDTTLVQKSNSNPSRDATLFALRELTGKNPGTTTKEWEVVLQPEMKPTPSIEDLTTTAGKDWRQFVTTMLPDLKAKDR